MPFDPFYGIEDVQNPFGTDGIFTQIGEHIPLINQGIQEMHRSGGHMGAYLRARARNPVGADGVVTQVGEHIPLVADGIEALHRINGETMAAERARARTLPRLLSKDGAVTKVAELIPGTNIVAAMVHQMNGNHDEAVRALSIFDNWTQVGEPDGPLAKVAELFPGMDVAAFALHVTNKHYAQALRSITKTKLAYMEAKSVTIRISGINVWEFEVSNSEIRRVEVEPQCLSLILGMNDVFTQFLEVDHNGYLRPRSLQRESPSSRRRREEEFQIVGQDTEELLSNWFNGHVRRVICRMKEDMPLYVEWTMNAANKWAFPRWRKEALRYYLLLEPTMPAPGPAFSEALQRAYCRATLRHSPLPPAAARVVLPPLKMRPRRELSKAALAAGALGVAGCCGAKAAAITCFGGLMAATASLSRLAYRFLHNHYNNSNIECWEGAALRLDPDVRQDRQQAETHGGILEMEQEDAVRMCQLVLDHVVANIRWGHLATPLFERIRPVLKALFKSWGPEWEVVPFVMDLETGDLSLETDVWPNGLKLPSMRVAVLCDLNVFGTGPSQVSVVIPDGLIDEFAQMYRQQLQELDMRTVDPRLAGFAEPLRLTFDLSCNWPEVNELEFKMTNLKSTLHLPE